MEAYSLVHESNKATRASVQDLQRALETGDDFRKQWAMRHILVTMYNGDSLPQLLMHVIRFVMPSRSKQLKKLLHLYWEIVPKLSPDGKLKQEIILVCNAIRNDLQHPNEFIRGATLRFLCKMREADLLESLVPSVRSCLDHRHAYVRKNAVFTVMAIAEHTEHLIPDAAEVITEVLEQETDATCKRNAFVALTRLDRDSAYSYFQRNYTSFSSLDEMIQLAFIGFIRQDATANPDLLSTYVQILIQSLESVTNVVAYDAASALAALTSSPQALAVAGKKYVEIAIEEADNNTKIIALTRVAALNKRAPGALAGLAMEILLVLNTPDVDVRKQALELAMALVTPRTVDAVVRLLKKELALSVGQEYDKHAEYRKAIISAIHTCAVRFKDVTVSVVDLLLDFVGDFNTASAVEVVKFVKEVVELYPALRPQVIEKLLKVMLSVHSSTVFTGLLWVVGEYCLDESHVMDAWLAIRQALGRLPLEALLEEENNKPESKESTEKKKPRVLADGTYATESALDETLSKQVTHEEHPLRKLIIDGKFYLGGALSATLTKLVLRALEVSSNKSRVNGMTAEALLAMTSILRVGEGRMDEDVFDRVYGCIQVLLSSDPKVHKIFLSDTHKAFEDLLVHERSMKEQATQSTKLKAAVAVETPVKFRLFENLAPEVLVDTAASVTDALSSGANDKIASQLKHIYQLTGYSDPIYAEAHMTVHQFDIVLDVMLFNQTNETLRNLSVEFYTVGEIKVVERPTTQNIAPLSFHTVQTTIKVTSADSGVIFGNIVYDGKSASEGAVVILNDIRLNILDYIKPATCTETEFREMWTSFEWENKLNISSSHNSLQEYMKSFMTHTNMGCLTRGVLENGDNREDEDCNFLSANFYARSSFGEDALANLSLELANGLVVGLLRIRSKTQGPAVSIGDRATELDHKAISV